MALSCAAATVSARAGDDTLRVGTSGDYRPFSFPSDADPAVLTGLDVEIARRYAADGGRALVLVPLRWPDLVADLAAGRFDVAMSGVTVRPERSLVGIFTSPVAESGAVVLTRDAARFRAPADLEKPGVRIAVNAGGHLERVARAAFARAHVIAVPDNAAVPRSLEDGTADAVVTDTLEAPAWRAGHPEWVALGPISSDRKAHLVRADRGALATDLDRWLRAREADGTLAALRARWLGEGAGRATAAPLPALLAAMDERLALMPLVAEAKRASKTAVEDAAREALVLDAAVAACERIAGELERACPPPPAVRALFRAQIEAAKAIQRSVLAGPAAAGPAPDLERALRPALLRLGDRVMRGVLLWWHEAASPALAGERDRPLAAAVAGGLWMLGRLDADERRRHGDAIAAALRDLDGVSRAATRPR